MQIVILGAGYAGLRTAIDLDRLLRQRGRDDEVILVDQHPYHQLIQVIHLAATDAIPDKKAIYELAPLLCNSTVRLEQGRVTRIEPLERQVRFEDGRSLAYDRLAITLGAETSYAGVAGAREHTLPLHTFEHALRLRDHVVQQFAAAAQERDPKQQRILQTIAIVGGGYTGCQLAGELVTWADDLCRDSGAPRSEVRVALIERSNYLLPQFGDWATQAAELVLDRQGVSVYRNTLVEAVEPRMLHIQGERVLRAATIVWAAGIAGPELLAASGLAVEEHGRVMVDRYLRVHDQALIFAAGDCAAVPNSLDGGTVPATASYAMRQGAHLATTLLAEVEGRAPRSYEPLRLGELVSLGPHYAVGNPLGLPMTGYPALWMKKSVEQYYRSILEEAQK
ncbi:NAD(P)/FAD-dependent oxidoreductase [Candidatus Viridilinea mediisalina]|uniref:Pyridine nucleotide-disulfide oxidoreductase n=1 Tax=Candidatus Viridilinea mediisalina TaxID=2024553 RepID=A0A2A6RMG2_9CHLR|nr:NAD(P)/FAD-dependent oxidoreductase [Candidatus Viridilinea mediisalina]PDW04106.1 pyridine nucleotide-disulfide oxidoreductase [Candidatus Viridilinea mediisalina]